MIKFLTVIFTSLTLILAPVINAYALSPAAGLSNIPTYSGVSIGGGSGAEATITTMAAGGTSAAGMLAVLAAALAVGTGAGYLAVGYICENNLSSACPTINPVARIPLSSGYGLSAPSAPAVVPVIVGGSQNDPVWLANATSSANVDACAFAQTSNSGYPSTCQYVVEGHVLKTVVTQTINGQNYSGVLGTSNIPQVAVGDSCPDGYTLTAGACALTSPRLAFTDDNVDYKRDVGGGVSALPDSDALSAQNKPFLGGNEAQFNGVITTVDGVKHEIWISNTGSSTGDNSQTQITINPNEYGNYSPSTLQTLTVDTVNGQIAGTSLTQTTGQVAAQGSTYTDTAGNTQTVQPGDIVLVTPNAPGVTTPPAQVAVSPIVQPAPKIDLPTDYARQGEAQTAANSIRDKLAETEPTDDLTEPVLVNPLSNYFNPLRSWSVPSLAGECPTGSFSWNNHDYNFDVICTLFNQNLTIIQGSMNVLYALGALFIVLGA